MHVFDIIRDATEVGRCAFAVALRYQALPREIADAGADAVDAALHWDATSARRIYDAVVRVRAELTATADDNETSAAWDALQAALQKLVADLS